MVCNSISFNKATAGWTSAQDQGCESSFEAKPTKAPGSALSACHPALHPWVGPDCYGLGAHLRSDVSSGPVPPIHKLIGLVHDLSQGKQAQSSSEVSSSRAGPVTTQSSWPKARSHKGCVLGLREAPLRRGRGAASRREDPPRLRHGLVQQVANLTRRRHDLMSEKFFTHLQVELLASRARCCWALMCCLHHVA